MRLGYLKFILGGLFFVCMVTIYPLKDLSLLKNHWPHRIGDQEVVLKKQKPSDWVSLNQISSHARSAIMLSEDWAFYSHGGIDLNQIKVVLLEMFEKDRLRGASTITQQVIKNIFLTHERSFQRKMQEMILAMKLEFVLSKNQIFEIYLNLIEFGPDLYGIKKAALYYFKKMPSELTAREGAFLAMVLPNPKVYVQSFKDKELSAYAEERIKKTLDKMSVAKIINEQELLQANKEVFNWEKVK
jgi:monofunctional biosynthetic peptidoglycan transglycosylase